MRLTIKEKDNKYGYVEYSSEMSKAISTKLGQLEDLMEKYNIDQAMLVGDTKFDIITANNVKAKFPKFKSVGVTWCKTSREEFQELDTDYIVDNTNELLEVINNYE